jgi:molecular chaperone HscB
MTQNPFALLGLTESFELDVLDLEKRVREVQRNDHPDRATTPLERRLRMGRAVDVNEAFRTLKDDLSRAKALLALRGVDVNGNEQPAEPDFLMEVMELREALGDAREAKRLAEVSQLGARVEVLCAATKAEFSARFSKDDFAGARSTLAKLRYYRRFLDEVAVIEEEATL